MNVEAILKIFKNQNTEALSRQNECRSTYRIMSSRLPVVLGTVPLVARSERSRKGVLEWETGQQEGS